MKQKIIKLISASALILAAGLIATGCKNDIDGTTVNFEEKKLEMTDNLGTADKAWTGYVHIDNTWINRAEKQSHIEVKIESHVLLDMSTVNDAITFYKLKNNEGNAAWYPWHDGTCTKELVGSVVEDCWSDYQLVGGGNNQKGLRTIFKYDVDTSGVTTKKIAVIVDATKLKDVFGNFVLNLDKNYKAGQESDSFIQYITIDRDKDGNSTTALSYNNNYAENFRQAYNPVNPNGLSITPNGSTGKYDITMPANLVNQPGEAAAYDETLASTMKAAFKLYVKAPEDAAYKPVDLDWAFDTNQYKAPTQEFAYGTKFKVVMIKPQISAPAWYSKVYGHAGFVDTDTTGSTTDLPNNSVTCNYIKDQPDYIVDNFTDADDSGETWASGSYSEDTIKNNQNALLRVSKSSNSKYVSGYWNREHTVYTSGYYKYYIRWTITPQTGLANDVILTNAEDFIVVGENNNKLDATVSIVRNNDEAKSVRTIYVELKNPVADNSEPKLYVGPGTTLKENKAYPRQLKFGTLVKDPLKGDASGYIPLSND